MSLNPLLDQEVLGYINPDNKNPVCGDFRALDGLEPSTPSL
jgi:hypothetical protein